MAIKPLPATEVSLPRFAVPELPRQGEIFALSSHRRAREALEFGLSIRDSGFNIFVLGDDRSARMSATLAFLEESVADARPGEDWVYLNNFRDPERPVPVSLPAGTARAFCDRMRALIPQLRQALAQAFSNEQYQTRVRQQQEALQKEVAAALDELRTSAESDGLTLAQTPEGISVTVQPVDGQPVDPATIPEDKRALLEERSREIGNKLRKIQREAARRQVAFAEWMHEYNQQVADNAVGGLLDEVVHTFQSYHGLARWLTNMRADVLDRIERFQPPTPETPPMPPSELPERRYAVNLLVDRTGESRPKVVLEPKPTLESLFGAIEYRQVGGVLDTDFTLLRAGALHHANGGILVLRAEALAADGRLWAALKAALRDREIRIEREPPQGGLILAGRPQPKAIPLDVKLVLVGAPRWYYAFFSVDPAFQTYFRIKADVDADMDATPENLGHYAALVHDMAQRNGSLTCTPQATQRLLGIAARWAGHRGKLTARIEQVEDVLKEAAELLPDGVTELSEEVIATAFRNRRQRNARVEDRLHESITDGTVMIDTQGWASGQINALTVRDMGDHAFGAPSRVTASASIGRRGVVNVERDIALGGPIQQKGVMVLQGFLAGHFARHFPLSFTCSITFEQSYGGVEGDSASLAELLAVLSDLSGLPLRQDLAITGSVNQHGQSQAVGGVHHKVEGFFRTCREAGPLTGEQGVVIPEANAPHLVLRQEVTDAVAASQFHIYAVATIDEAVELFTGKPAGEPDAEGRYPADSVYGRVFAELARFDRILAERDMRPAGHAA